MVFDLGRHTPLSLGVAASTLTLGQIWDAIRSVPTAPFAPVPNYRPGPVPTPFDGLRVVVDDGLPDDAVRWITDREARRIGFALNARMLGQLEAELDRPAAPEDAPA